MLYGLSPPKCRSNCCLCFHLYWKRRHDTLLRAPNVFYMHALLMLFFAHIFIIFFFSFCLRLRERSRHRKMIKNKNKRKEEHEKSMHIKYIGSMKERIWFSVQMKAWKEFWCALGQALFEIFVPKTPVKNTLMDINIFNIYREFIWITKKFE